MVFYLHRYPKFFDRLYPNRVWRKKEKEKVIYLTFDDGPEPQITNWIIDLLGQYDIKATFFCVGENLSRYPEVKSKMLDAGHQLANHTHNHNNGRKTDWDTYRKSIQSCESQIGEIHSKKLFRPPYGKLSKAFGKRIAQEYEIIMWTVLSGDFDSKLTQEGVLKNTIRSTKSGSIVVFHDNIKCLEKNQWVLPRYLESMLEQGYKFELL